MLHVSCCTFVLLLEMQCGMRVIPSKPLKQSRVKSEEVPSSQGNFPMRNLEDRNLLKLRSRLSFLLQNPRTPEGFQNGVSEGVSEGFSKGFSRDPILKPF